MTWVDENDSSIPHKTPGHVPIVERNIFVVVVFDVVLIVIKIKDGALS